MYARSFLLLLLASTSSLFGEGFLPGTLVKTPTTSIPIEQLQVDEKVICYDFDGHCIERPITNITKATGDSFVEIGIGDEKIYTAPDHKFFLPQTQEWIEAKDLTAGHVLLRHCTDLIMVDSVRHINKSAEFHDITVDEYHNFCVSKYDIHVHNFFPLLAFTITWVPGVGVAIGGGIAAGAVALGGIFWGSSEEAKKEVIFREMESAIARTTTYQEKDKKSVIDHARKTEDFPPGHDDDWKKIKGSDGFIDPDGNRWKKDKLHKDHWDVSNPKGKQIKEVGFGGNQIWPEGPKNKNKDKK